MINKPMKSSGCRWILTVGLSVIAAVWSGVGFAANPSNGLRIEVIAAYNLVVDSNVESPSTYAPRAAYLGAKYYNDGTNDLTSVSAFIGDYINGINDTPGLYPTNRHPAYPTIVGPLAGGGVFADA